MRKVWIFETALLDDKDEKLNPTEICEFCGHRRVWRYDYLSQNATMSHEKIVKEKFWQMLECYKFSVDRKQITLHFGGRLTTLHLTSQVLLYLANTPKIMTWMTLQTGVVPLGWMKWHSNKITGSMTLCYMDLILSA